jgi:hypothetical protein
MGASRAGKTEKVRSGELAWCCRAPGTSSHASAMSGPWRRPLFDGAEPQHHNSLSTLHLVRDYFAITCTRVAPCPICLCDRLPVHRRCLRAGLNTRRRLVAIGSSAAPLHHC